MDYYDQLIAKASDVQCARSISECIVGYVPKVSNMMGVPIAISDGTLYIDVDTDTVGLAYNQKDNKTDETEGFVRENANTKNFMMTSGLIGSYLEGYVVGKTTNTKGVSSVSIIKEAKERGINIYTLSEENKDELSKLSIESTAKKEIEKALNNDKIVIVPEKSMYYYDWHGTGYIILNPKTGEAAYMISGGLCGGESSQDLAMAIFTIIVAIAAVFVYFAWSAFAAMIGVIFTLNEGISILDTCIILLSLAGAIFSIVEAGNVGIGTFEYIMDPSGDKGLEILSKALEAGVMFLIFEVAMPRLMTSIGGKINFDESRFYQFITKKWGGKSIKTPNVKPDIDPDIKPDTDLHVKPDTDPNVKPNINPDGGKQYRDKLLDDVESGEIELKTNKQKGNYGEMKMDKYLEELGYERISLNRVTGLDDAIHQGIDGVYYNPNGNPQYIIAEAKYGSARLSNTLDGLQMSDEWINGSNRLNNAVGDEMEYEIIKEGFDKWLVRITTEGNIIKTVLE